MVLHLLLRAVVHATEHAAAEGAAAGVRAANYGQVVHATRQLKAGSVYVGDWMIGTGPHGMGRITLKSGGVYEGQWSNGKINGRGTFTYGKGNGGKYTGDFVNAKRHGSGTFWYRNGDIYVGGWENDQKCGAGTFYRKNGNVAYNGYYRANKRHGMGDAFFLNGDRYTGNFVNGKQSGQGTYHFANGDMFRGRFRNGARVDGEYLFAVNTPNVPGTGAGDGAGAGSGGSGPTASAPPPPPGSGSSKAQQPVAVESEEPADDDGVPPADGEVVGDAPPPEVSSEAVAALSQPIQAAFSVLCCFPGSFTRTAAVGVLTAVKELGGRCAGGDGANDAVDTLVAASVLTVGDGGSLTVPYSLAVLIQDAGAASDVGVDDGLIMGAIADYFTSRLRVLAELVVEGDSTAQQEAAWLELSLETANFQWALATVLDRDVMQFVMILLHVRRLIPLFPAAVSLAWLRRCLSYFGIDDVATATPFADGTTVLPGAEPYPKNTLIAVLLEMVQSRMRLMDDSIAAVAAAKAGHEFALSARDANDVARVECLLCEGCKAALVGKSPELAGVAAEVATLCARTRMPTAALRDAARRVEAYKLVGLFKRRAFKEAGALGLELAAKARTAGVLFNELMAQAFASFGQAMSAGGNKPALQEAKLAADKAVVLAQKVLLKECTLLALLAQGVCCLKLKDTESRYGIRQFEQVIAIAQEYNLLGYQASAALLVSSSLSAVGETSRAVELVRQTLVGTANQDGSKVAQRHLLCYGLLVKLERYTEGLTEAKAALARCREWYALTRPGVQPADYTQARTAQEAKCLLGIANCRSLTAGGYAEALRYILEYIELTGIEPGHGLASSSAAETAHVVATPVGSKDTKGAPAGGLVSLLAQLRLSQHEEAFRQLGVESKEDLQDVGEDDLAALGLTKIQQNRFLRAQQSGFAGDATATVPATGAGGAGAGGAGAGAGTKATAGAGAGAGGGGGAVFEVPPNGFEPRLIFFRIALRIAQKATGAPLADRVRVFATLRSQAIRLNYKSTESSVCLSYGIAVAKTDPHTAVSLFQDGLIAMSQVTKVTAATKQVKKSLVENLVKTKSALGPYKKPKMVPDDDRDNCTLCHLQFTMFTRRRHHCRCCGKLFCDDCSRDRVVLPSEYGAGKDSVRVCQTCNAYLAQLYASGSVV